MSRSPKEINEGVYYERSELLPLLEEAAAWGREQYRKECNVPALIEESNRHARRADKAEARVRELENLHSDCAAKSDRRHQGLVDSNGRLAADLDASEKRVKELEAHIEAIEKAWALDAHRYKNPVTEHWRDGYRTGFKDGAA